MGFYAAKHLFRLARAFPATRRNGVIADLGELVLHVRPARPCQHRTFVLLAFSGPYLHRFCAIPDLHAPTLTNMARPPSADEDTVMSSSSVDVLADTFEVVVILSSQLHKSSKEARCLSRYPASLDDSLPDWVSSGIQ